MAEEIAGNSWSATVVRAILAGALITLLSYTLNAVDTVAAHILVAYLVGFFLALGPVDHVVVPALHLLFGIWLDLGLSTLGNLLGACCSSP